LACKKETTNSLRRLESSFLRGFPFFLSIYLIKIPLFYLKYRGDAHLLQAFSSQPAYAGSPEAEKERPQTKPTLEA
jgi:hypothetical protein